MRRQKVVEIWGAQCDPFLESARANQKVLIAPIFCEIHKFKCGDPIEKKVKEAYNLELNVAFGKLNVTFNKSQVI